MKKETGLFFSIALLYGLFSMALFTSCIHDDDKDCPVSLSFNYSYNIKNANAFELEVSKVSVWLFDEGGKFIVQYIDEGSHIDNGYQMNLPDLQAGNYTLVAWARGCSKTDEYANCDFPVLTAGVSTLDDLNPRFKRKENNLSDAEFNPLLAGSCQLNFSNIAPVHCTVDMMKITNKVRILLMPVGSAGISAEKYDFRIEAENGWLNYEGDKYVQDFIGYQPYYTETLYPPGSRTDEGNVKSVAIASINTSRLFHVENARFSVTDRESGEEKFVLENLTWYLSLLATLEHSDRWGAQEYLDREDYYDITIYVDGETFMKNKIVIKDWVISIDDDIEL